MDFNREFRQAIADGLEVSTLLVEADRLVAESRAGRPNPERAREVRLRLDQLGAWARVDAHLSWDSVAYEGCSY